MRPGFQVSRISPYLSAVRAEQLVARFAGFPGLGLDFPGVLAVACPQHKAAEVLGR